MWRGTYLGLLLIAGVLCLGTGSIAYGCPACWAGYGKGDERFNKPLADCRIVYERDGRDAIPYLRDVLATSTDPLVIQRAAGYIVELNDVGTAPLMEDLILQLTKKVAFGAFGYGTFEFRCRLAVAHALPKLQPTQEFADKLWVKYDKMNLDKKTEIPYILMGLQDAHLQERLFAIIDNKEDHQLMIGALDVFEIAGTPEAVPVLKAKAEEWSNKSPEPANNPSPNPSMIYYSALKIKAEKAAETIGERQRESAA